MPSISSMFGGDGLEADQDFDLDLDKLMGEVDKSLAESTRFDTQGLDEVEEPEPEPVEDPQDVQSPGDATGEEEPAGESAPEDPPPLVADPLGLLPPERRAALLAIDEVVQRDPSKRDAVLAALRDQAPVVQAPQLPDDIEEGSVAARLWHEHQETREQLAQIAGSQKATQEAFAKQAAVSAADAAGDEFARRYPQLETSDIVSIAQVAGNSGLAARLAAGADDLKGAYLQALESTLWTNESFRPKVLGVQAPTETGVAAEHKAESKTRKRKLTAVGSAASPVSAPAEKRSPLETRVDGRLTPQSRLSVTKEIASQLNRSQNEGNY